MDTDMKYGNTPRFLGAAFLIVIVTSLIAGIPLNSIVGNSSGASIDPGSISDMLARVFNNPTLMHVSVLGGLLNSAGIVILATLLYVVLNGQNKTLALAALGLWLAEAIFFAIMQIGLLALIPLSHDFVNATAPVPAFYQTLGDFFYNGIYSQGITIHMWFYCVGGLLWYYLFYRSKYVPRIISLFGLLAVTLGLAGIVFQLFGYSVPMFAFLPIGLFELIIGVWLLLKGIKDIPKNEVIIAE
ncbi:MAG TPA: DUF4386 domain-containing protein [Methanocella sp.]|uniref:DUF4386 domain-containing protein n=1 Tax=Methanocella sp. TaxID=2052833 RepID=UPI002CD42DA5|nr:DUF4386 domain-containing protein [Methanocella sp.]HTY92203.1 DUF4386 domain-containing protein [Methanocella sp.]